jgi:hypothetical protein
MRYQDAVINDGEGRVHADLTRLSLVEPDLHGFTQTPEDAANRVMELSAANHSG